MTKVVISQPMFFPWVGLFEQILLADVYVHYDDVQFSKGSFVNRVQIKSHDTIKWLTVPLRNHKLGDSINQVFIDKNKDWINNHISLLAQTYMNAPYKKDLLDILNYVYAQSFNTISDLSVASITAICEYFNIKNKRVIYSSDLNISGRSSQRVLEIVKYLEGSTYITGHGARNYLDHELFERNQISVEYMDYKKTPYPQIHGNFTPYVSILDLIANTGTDGIKYIASTTKKWREFINE